MRDEMVQQLLTEQEMMARLRANGALGVSAAIERTHYQVLQVDPAAEPEVIEAAFRRLALKYHPDTSTDPNASERMRDILEAREILSDPQRRLSYDRSIGIARRPPAFRAEDI
jgi:curved DNA-binding protein CbpA